MSETVKLIIEIPKEHYEFTKGAKTARVFPSEYYVELILNGMPLDDVKAEIYDKAIKDKNGDGFIFLGRLEKIFNSIGKGDKE